MRDSQTLGENMAFRADEAERTGREEAEQYLIGRLRGVDAAEIARSREKLADLVEELGPVVDAYPSWHPLVRQHNAAHPVTFPGQECGYRGLDHTVLFAHGFVTCPYDDGQRVLDSVQALAFEHPAATIRAERLDVKFYQPNANPILVRADWHKPIALDKTIPLSIALPLLLEMEVPCWQESKFAESWDTMRTCFLGMPSGARSSLFVSQETGQAIKKIWESLINTGMFGPIQLRK
jgi:hypothetical protein